MVRIVIRTKRSSPEPAEGHHKRQKSRDRTSANIRPSDTCSQEVTGTFATHEGSSVGLEIPPSVPTVFVEERDIAPAKETLPQYHHSPDCQLEKIKCDTEALKQRIEQVYWSNVGPLEALDQIDGIVTVQEVESLFDKTQKENWPEESNHECSHLHATSEDTKAWVMNSAFELLMIREEVLKLYTGSLQAAMSAARDNDGGDDFATQGLEALCERLTQRYGSIGGLLEETLGEQMDLDDPV